MKSHRLDASYDATLAGWKSRSIAECLEFLVARSKTVRIHFGWVDEAPPPGEKTRLWHTAETGIVGTLIGSYKRYSGYFAPEVRWHVLVADKGIYEGELRQEPSGLLYHLGIDGRRESNFTCVKPRVELYRELVAQLELGLNPGNGWDVA